MTRTLYYGSIGRLEGREEERLVWTGPPIESNMTDDERRAKAEEIAGKVQAIGKFAAFRSIVATRDEYEALQDQYYPGWRERTARFAPPLSLADRIMLKTSGGSPYQIILGTLPEFDFCIIAFACGMRLVVPSTHEEEWSKRNNRLT